MSTIRYLRSLLEGVDAEDVVDMLVTSPLESDLLVAKGSTILAKEIASAKAEKDPKEKKVKWKKALRDAKALRKKANEIPPDNMTDHAWRALTSPWWSSAMDYGTALLKREKLKDMSKNDAIEKFDMMIAYIERQIDKLDD